MTATHDDTTNTASDESKANPAEPEAKATPTAAKRPMMRCVCSYLGPAHRCRAQALSG